MEPFIAQIVMFGGNFAPRAWAFCNGQLLAISQNTALFSLLGTTYGGDGRTTFALPDLRGRVAIHSGGSTGPGLSPYQLGQRGGTQTVNLSVLQMPSHNHFAQISGSFNAIPQYSTLDASDVTPAAGQRPAKAATKPGLGAAVDVAAYNADDTTLVNGAPIPVVSTGGGSVTIGLTGGSQAHTNIQPYLAINYIIAMQGTFPSRN